MVQFSVPVSKALTGKRFCRFSVTHNNVLLVGSRHGVVPDIPAHNMVFAFANLDFFFLTGCARGVDQSFREALLRAELWDWQVVNLFPCSTLTATARSRVIRH